MRAAILLIVSCVCSYGATFYVATNGTDTATGTVEDPLSISKAVGLLSPVSPGDVINLRGGTYTNTVISRLSGINSSRIYFKSAPGERVVFDSTNAFQIEGSYTTYSDIWIIDSSTNRNITRISGVGVNSSFIGSGNKMVNCILKDLGNSIFVSYQSTGFEASGCIILGSGYQLSDRGHGHHIYSQNRSTNVSYYYDNIGINSFHVGVNIRSSDITRDMYYNGNVIVNSGALSTNGLYYNYVTEGTFCDNITLTENYGWYNAPGQYGQRFWSLSTNGLITLTGNVFPDFTQVFWWTNVVWNGNTQYTSIAFRRPSDNSSVVGDSNRYFSVVLNVPVNLDNTNLTLAQWRSIYGNGTNDTAVSTKPESNWVYVRRNRHDNNRANIIVYNWESNNTQTVNLSNLAKPGDHVTIYHSESPFESPVFAGSMSSDLVTIPMTNLPAFSPVGTTNYAPSWPGFATFIALTIPADRSKIRGIRFR